MPHLESGIEALVDGQRQQSLTLADRGLHYGDGLFETVAVVAGRPALWQRHIDRLLWGCERLLLPPPDLALLHEEALSLAAGHTRAVLKIIYTAGSGRRGYARPDPLSPRRILLRLPAPAFPTAYWRDGVDAGYCALRLTPQGPLAGIKHLGRIEQVLARREVDGRGLVEGLMLNQAGEVVEGVASNLFAVFDGQLLTPPITDCGVRGVMRDHVMALAEDAGLAVAERALDPVMLDEADELFLSNSLIGLWPIRNLEGRHRHPGPVVRRLQRMLTGSGSCLAPDDFENHA